MIEARSCGSYTIRQTDSTQLQVDPEAVVFSAPPSAPGEHPTVHTIPVSRPPPIPPPAAPPPPEEEGGAPAEVSNAKLSDKRKHSRGKHKVELLATPDGGKKGETDAPTDAEKRPEKPAVSDTVCETVDGQRRVFRATRKGRLVKVSD